MFDRAAKTQVTAFTENLSTDALLANVPAPGKVVSSKTIPSVNVTEWTLSNGVRVLVKPTDFKADEVLFNASSPGGSSLAPDADYMSAGFASQIVGLSGLGQFNRIDLQKKLSGKVASAGASIGGTSEGLSRPSVAEGSRDDVPADLPGLHGAAFRSGGIRGIQGAGRSVSGEPWL